MAELTLLEFIQKERDRGAFDDANATVTKLGLPEVNPLNVESALWYILSTAVIIQEAEMRPGEEPAPDSFWHIEDVGGELTLVFKKIPEKRFTEILTYGNRRIIQRMLGKLLS